MQPIKCFNFHKMIYENNVINKLTSNISLIIRKRLEIFI